MLREGLLQLTTDEVNLLCGASYRPQESGLYRRAGTEPVRIRTSEGAEFIDKRRVRKLGQDGREQEVLLNSYAEIKWRKGMFEEVLESICDGGLGQRGGQDARRECEAGLRGLEGPQEGVAGRVPGAGSLPARCAGHDSGRGVPGQGTMRGSGSGH